MKHELTTYRIEQVVFNEGTAWEETADEYVPDGRLQAIADAWQRVDYPERHIIRKAAGELVAVVEDALGGTDE